MNQNFGKKLYSNDTRRCSLTVFDLQESSNHSMAGGVRKGETHIFKHEVHSASTMEGE